MNRKLEIALQELNFFIQCLLSPPGLIWTWEHEEYLGGGINSIPPTHELI